MSAVLLGFSLLNAVLVEIQSDYLGNKSEAGGGFDPTVFPPFDTVTWLIAMAAPWGLALLLVLTIITRATLPRDSAQRMPD